MNPIAQSDEPRTTVAQAGSSLDDPRVFSAVAEYLAEIEAGRRPDRAAFLARHADIAGQLCGCLLAVEAVQGAVPSTLFIDLKGDASALPPGAMLSGFRILREVGRGGMGVVYLAADTRLNRLVALKVMKPLSAADAVARKRFLREAQAASTLRHDHIITIYQVGEDSHVPFLAMEFLRGESLEDRLRRGPLALPEALRIAREVAAGLTAAHEAGLVHRDIKPANLFLVSGEWSNTPVLDSPLTPPSSALSRVKILDFGLARLALPDGDGRLTQTGVAVGTPQYMAPEQAAGDPLDHRADLFSLGCVLYRMLTGAVPFSGNSLRETFKAVMLDPPQSRQALRAAAPRALADLTLQLLAKNPRERPQSAREVSETLRRIEQKLDVTAPGSAAPARCWRVLYAAVLVLVLGAAALVAYQMGAAPAEEETAPRPVPAEAKAAPRPAPSRDEALAALHKLGARLEIDEKSPGKPVITIDLSGTEVTDADLIYIAAFPEVVSLDLSNVKISDAGLAHLRSFTALLDLRLRNTGVTNAGLKPLLVNKGLLVLILSNVKVTDALMPDLGQLPEMQRLDLTGTQVTDAGLVHLHSLKKLTCLAIGPNITDAGFEHIQHHTKLTQLVVESKHITDKGTGRLGKLTNLSSLSLNGPLTDKGVEVLRHLPNLGYLNLIGTKINGSCLQHLCCHETLQSLHVDDTDLTDDALIHIRGMAQLHTVGLRATKVTDTGMEHLETLPSLQSLSLKNTSVGDPGIKHLAGMETLAYLFLASTNVTSAGMKHVATLKGLKTLGIENTLVGDPGLALLESLPALEELSIRGTQVTAKGVAHFQAARPNTWTDLAPMKK